MSDINIWCLNCNHPDYCHIPVCNVDMTGTDPNTPCDCHEFKPQKRGEIGNEN